MTYGHQIFIVGAFHLTAPTDRFSLVFTYLSNSQESQCKNPIFGQPGCHISSPLHTETCNLAHTNLLKNPDGKPKTVSLWPTSLEKIRKTPKKWPWMSILNPA